MEGVVNQFWRGRRVLVTGATGLVGSWLVSELLERGANVVALIRDYDPQSELLRSGKVSRCSVVNGAVEEPGTVERAISLHETDTVFHLAAQTIVGTAVRNPVETFESNIRGTYMLLEACRRQRATVSRVLFASSDKAYGTSKVLPYTEEMPLAGEHPYDVSKSCSDLIAQAYFHTYQLPVVVARCGNIFGGGDLNWSRLIPGTIASLLRGERPVIRSDGKFKRDYVYVKDAVNAYLLMAEHADKPAARGQAFNFGPNAPMDVLSVVSAVAKQMGREDLQPDIRNEAKAEIRDQYLASTRAAQVLGWAPGYSFDAGLRETIAWYRALLGAADGK